MDLSEIMYTPVLLLLVLFRVLSVSRTSRVEVSDWRVLNETVGGKLGNGIPFSQPCFSTFNGKEVCVNTTEWTEIQTNYLNPQFRASHFGAYMQVCLLHFVQDSSSF